MGIRIGSIVKVEKKECIHDTTGNDVCRYSNIKFYNQGQEDYGNREVGLDVGKIASEVFDTIDSESFLKMYDDGDVEGCADLIAEALKAKEGELIIEKVEVEG